jgi:putative oxygen-independent coproporphyrinogen III oxidase
LTAVYVHVPWCLQRCPYCDFATEAIRPDKIPHEPYADSVLAELSSRAHDLDPIPLRTVFFGGGTPSLWRVPSLARVLRGIERALGGASADEVTVECNPTSLDQERARALVDIGVNRVSIGVQSLRDLHLRYLGRLHDRAQALDALRAAARVPGLRVTADLMFGMPEQREEELVEDVRVLLDLGVRHLSIYALTIESNTRFGELARKGRLPRLPDDDVARLFEAIERVTESVGMEHYEVSNYAFEGERGRHNESYWRGDLYLGLGAGAVGCTRRGEQVARYRNVYDVPGYLAAGARGARCAEDVEVLSVEDRVREGLMLGLRTADGVDLASLGARLGIDPRAGRERAIARAVSRGLLLEQGDRLRIPRSRWLIADDIVSGLF